ADEYRAAITAGDDRAQRAAFHAYWAVPHETDARIIEGRFATLLDHTIANTTPADPTGPVPRPHLRLTYDAPARTDTTVIRALEAAIDNQHHDLQTALDELTTLRTEHRPALDSRATYDWIGAITNAPIHHPTIAAITHALTRCQR